MSQLKDLKVGVVGGGVVGQATARCYLEHVGEVRIHDVIPERSTHALEEVLRCDLVFVCLPTPQRGDSLKCDLSAVEGFFGSFRSKGSCWAKRDEVNFVLRSTVPIGTTRRLADHYGLDNLVHSPEFLTARCATLDAQVPSRSIIGLTGNGFNAPLLRELYRKRFPGAPVLTMSSDESEAVKLIQNSFFAVKVAFWNEVYNLVERLGLGWDTIHRAILADGRIHPAHTQVPGPDGGFGFGGTCLPKDLASLLCHLTEHHLLASVIEGALHRNAFDRKRTPKEGGGA